MVLPGPFRAAIIHRPGHPAFFRCDRQQTEKNRNDHEMRFHISANANFTEGELGGDEGHRFTELRILEKREEKTIGLKHCDLSQLR